MIYTEEDKKLVDQYKQTNIALRKQLNALNQEIDRQLVKKSNKIGLHKLPSVSKKLTNTHVMQQQVDTMRKRLQLIEKQKQNYEQKAQINFHEKVRQALEQISQKQAQAYELKKEIKYHERLDKIADVHNESKQAQTNKIQKKIQFYQQEITRNQKMQKELLKQLQYHETTQIRNSNHLKQLTTIRKEKMKQSNSPKMNSPPKPPKQKQKQKQDKKKKEKQKKQITEDDWKKLKKQFLTFKESKQNEQFLLNQENERLRAETADIQRKLKEKRSRIRKIQDHAVKMNEKTRNSTLEPKQNKPYRYRDRNNSIQYNTKN